MNEWQTHGTLIRHITNLIVYTSLYDVTFWGIYFVDAHCDIKAGQNKGDVKGLKLKVKEIPFNERDKIFRIG